MKAKDLQILNDLLTATREGAVTWRGGYRKGLYRLSPKNQSDDYSHFGYVELSTGIGLASGSSFYFEQVGSTPGGHTQWLNRFSNEGRLVKEICRLAELQIQEREKQERELS